jgi:hypothetical protein
MMMPINMPIRNPRRILPPLLPPSAMLWRNPLLLPVDVGDGVDAAMLVVILAIISVTVGMALGVGLGFGLGFDGKSGLGSNIRGIKATIYTQLSSARPQKEWRDSIIKSWSKPYLDKYILT